MAATGKLVRVSELDMGYVRGSNKWAPPVKTAQMTEAEHKKMAEFYQFIFNKFFEIVPAAQQWGICQWCPQDAPDNDYDWRAGEPVGIWDKNFYRKHVYAGFANGLKGVANSIDNVKTGKVVNTPEGIYNLNGVRMQPGSTGHLPSGLYIVNGKKVVMK